MVSFVQQVENKNLGILAMIISLTYVKGEKHLVYFFILKKGNVP